MVAAGFALQACKDSTSPPALLNATDAEIQAVIAAVADASTRLTPSLVQLSARASLTTALAQLSGALATKQKAGVTTALGVARDVLASTASTAPPDDLPDRGAISLALDQVGILAQR